MWKNIKQEKPTKPGHYYCFGTRWKGTEYEEKTKFSAYYQGVENDYFTDKNGEDLTDLNDSVEYWFDFSLISNPE